MKEKQNMNKKKHAAGEWALFGLTALFLCALFVLRLYDSAGGRRIPGGGVVKVPVTGGASAPDDAPAGDSVPVEGDASAGDSVPVENDTPEPNHVPETEAVPESAPVTQMEAVREAESAPETEAGVSAEPSARGSESGPAAGRVNLNTADAAELQTLPGIGPVLAERIIQYRAEHGSFPTVDALTEVSGIGEKRLAAVRDLVTVG